MLNTLSTLHQTTWKSLALQYSQGRLGHALLFTGPEGIGKFDMAQAMARHMLGLSGDISEHPDLLFCRCLEDKKQLGIDQIRELCEQSQQTTHQGKARVIIINQADTMTPSAANALLKTLEEPGLHNYFFLISAHPLRLPMTIRSRCQLLTLSPPLARHAKAWLRAKVENLDEHTLDRLMFFAFDKPALAWQIHQDGLLNHYELAWEAVCLCLEDGTFNPWPILELNDTAAVMTALQRYVMAKQCDPTAYSAIGSGWQELIRVAALFGGEVTTHVGLTLFTLLHKLFNLFQNRNAYATR